MIPWIRLGIAAGALAVAAGAGWTVRGWRADAAISKLEAQHAVAVAEAQRQATEAADASAATAARLAQLAQETMDALAAAEARLARSAAALDGTRGRVLDAWARNAAASRCPDPGNPAAVAAAEQADVVRADVFRSATARAAELAGSVDRLDAYARSCARMRSEKGALARAVRPGGRVVVALPWSVAFNPRRRGEREALDEELRRLREKLGQ